jgi:hypothetical protein
LGIYAVRDQNGSYDPGTNYSISLYSGGTLTSGNALSGGTLLKSVTPVELSNSAFTDLTLTYTSPGSVTAGQDLDIVISLTDSSGLEQVVFDDVTLNATSNASSTPDGSSTMILMGIGLSALACVRCKRQRSA